MGEVVLPLYQVIGAVCPSLRKLVSTAEGKSLLLFSCYDYLLMIYLRT
jgi:hypothetical protein